MVKEPIQRRKKLFPWVAGGAAALLIALLAVLLLLPKLVDFNPIREMITTGISEKIAGTVDFRKMEVTLFPRPRILTSQARFSLPGTAEGTIDSLSIYPRIIPLFLGKVRISRIQIEAPRISFAVSKKQDDGKQTPLNVQEMAGNASALLSAMATNMPGTSIGIEKGGISISDADLPLFTFQDIEAQAVLSPGEAAIDLTCSSNISKGISLGIRFNPDHPKGTGTLKLIGMRPQPVFLHFLPDFAGRLGDSEGDLTLSFKMLGPKDVRAEVQASFPDLNLANGNETVPLKGAGMRAAVSLAGGRTEITLHELRLEYPQMTLSGVLAMDSSARNVRMEISGSRVDVTSLRGTALSLVGEFPVVQDIFTYLRGGKVPFITVRSRGTSMEDLGKTESLFIKGLIQQGEIHVPGLQLDFREVNGDCVISRGILEGKNIEGNLGNSQVRDGRLRVGLKGGDAPLHIDAEVKADLAEAKDVLKRLVKDEALLKEIGLVRTIHGEAKGRLTLGESTDSIRARVDLSEVSFTAEHQRIPFPVVIKGGRFTYAENRIGVRKLSGTLGRSSFGDIAGELRLGDSPSIEIPSGRLRIMQDEIYPWLASFEGLKGSLKDLRSLRGALNLGAIGLKGPLLRPREWRFRVKGSVENVVIDGAFLPGPASLKKGTFQASEKKVSLRDVRADILDASLVISGIGQGYLGGRRKTDITFQGRMGARSCEWASGLAGLPPQFSPGDSIAFEHAHVALDRETTLFQGTLIVHHGLKIVADVLKHPKGLTVKRLMLKDESTDATLSLDLKEKNITIAFAGKLNSETLTGLVEGKELPSGRISGDFRADIRRDKPFRFTAGGRARGEGIVLPANWKIPVVVETVSLAGDGHTLAVESSSLKLDDTPFSLKGSLSFTREFPAIDMDLSADRMEWGGIAEMLEAAGKGEGRSKDAPSGMPFMGTVRARLNQFTFDKYAWMPLHADISFRKDDMDIAVTRAALCGISFPGKVHITPKEISLDFQPHAENRELKPVLACLFGKEQNATGTFDLKAGITGRGPKEKLRDSLRGDVEYLARNGRIFGRPALLNIFSFLEVNQILRGFPEIRQEGFAYRSIKAKGELKQGMLEVRELIVEGPSMNIAAQGMVDLKNDKLDLNVLICPLKTTDFIINKTPILGSILGGSLVSIPLKISGGTDDPKVSYDPVSAVGSGLLGILERTIKTPFRLFDLSPSDEKR